MAALMRRWIGLGTATTTPSNSRESTTPVAPKSVLGKKRSHVDFTGSKNENEQSSAAAKKRAKRAFVDISHDASDDEIAVAHRPLGELNAGRFANSRVEISEMEFANKIKRKLYVKPALIDPENVAEYSRSASSTMESAVRLNAASSSKRGSRTFKAPAQDRRLTDLRKLCSPKVATSILSKRSTPDVTDFDANDGIDVTPRKQLGTRSDADGDEESYSRRGSRRTASKSYALMDLADSEDELAASPAKAKKGKLRAQQDDDDDFTIDEEQVDDVVSDYDDEAELARDLGETSSEEGLDEEEEEDTPKGKSTKRTQIKVKSSSRITSSGNQTKSKKSRLRMVNLKSGNAEAKKINQTLPPLFEIEDIFSDITSKALTFGLKKVVDGLGARPIRVATMCSGTESPLLALEMIGDCLSKSGLRLAIEHLFSAEIVPFKQAYIERNFNPPVIFRDITELTSVMDDAEPMATTAYGGKAPVPKEVDMVIAGTSCVDFSGLNSHQKDMDDGGESADTWNAVLSYCRAFRPAIVLLENVSGADWDRMLGDYEAIGYECSGAMVNTRDYYLPQVRERGYMACFDKASNGYAPSAEKWVDLMERFKRPASSPVSDFLIPNDKIIQKLIRNDEPTREHDWKQCEITQMEYRQDMRLGWARPVTHWSESGWMLAPDNGHAPWYHKQVERVLDTIDGAVLRKALDMYDCRFKTRIFDLSQNIYRETDHRPFGISGCITPSGIYFVTDLGRVLTSEETLKLQGLPLEKISFTTEQQSEIQSLAGNAMSSTVIAASILSALIPGFRAIDTRDRDSRLVLADSRHLSNSPHDRKLVNGSSEHVRASTLDHFDLKTLLQKAEMATRRCYCEGSASIAVKPIQQCKDCGQTTCTSCGGNPIHDYRQMDQPRMLPADFRGYAQSVVPLRLAFASVSVKSAQFEKLWPSTQFGQAASAALRGLFSFHSIRRTHCWAITYTSENAVLDLVLSAASQMQAEWRLYASPGKNLPGNSPLRGMLQQPVARSTTDKSTLESSKWLLRIPKIQPKALSMTITGSGPKVASWWSRMEMPDFANHTVTSFLHIEVEGASNVASVVSGEYQYLPRCGKASNSLYKKVGSDWPTFLFLDPTRTGEPEDDCFIFSHNIDRLEKEEVRPVIARIVSTWRPWAVNGKTRPAKLLVDESWHELPGCTLAAEDLELTIDRSIEPAALADSTKCSELAVFLSCNVGSAAANFEDHAMYNISVDDISFFKSNAWIFEAMRRHLPASNWHDFQNLDHAGARCNACAPTRPALRWGLSEDGKELRPYEDPRGAALYERAMKTRPDPIMIIVKPNDTDSGSTVSLGLDIATLAHRAGARLPDSFEISYQWRFVTTAQANYKFKPFKLRDTRGLLPYKKDLHMSIHLFPQQLMSLSWMKKQEEGVPFLLEEGEEANVEQLGWRAEVRAFATKTVRGGICADHPGFGKTITSLALIHSEFCESESSAADIQTRLMPRAHGYLPHAGTLIVCPASLIEQWVDEIHQKIEYGNRKLCVLRTVVDLGKHTISDFQNFKIVLVSRALLSNDNYIERLAAFAGVPGPTSNKGRSFTQWLEFANKQIPKHVEVRRRGLKELRQHIEAVYQAHVTSDEFKANVPSKRLTGADYIAGKEMKVNSTAKAKAPPRVNTSHVEKPLLEMFYWNRIIVDEFHQTEAKQANVAVVAMKADTRWGLSATPALGDFYEVARMAELIGVPLRMGSDGAGIMKNASVKELRKDMTSFELFDAMRQTPSDSMHSRIHENDQRFLNTFVRQNIMDHDELQYQDHLVPVTLDLDHRALYAELSQHLNSADMRIKKKTKATDRDKRFNEAVSTSITAEEALSKVAAFSNRGNVASTGGDDKLNLSTVVRDRQAAVDSILRKLPTAISEAKGTEDAFAKWLQSRLKDGTLGDAETCEQILKLAKAETGVSITADKLIPRRDRGEDYGIGKRALTAFLNGLCNRLLVEKRSARYMQNLHDLQQVARDDNVEITCDSPECGTMNSLDVAMSALCGHMICRDCYTKRRESENIKCLSPGCSSPMADHHLFWPSKGDLFTATPYGAKIHAAVKLLQMIESKNEQAILFVQFPNQLDEVEMALDAQGIRATIVKSAEKAGVQIQAFREEARIEKQKTVIVLNSSDETAAGSNLQNANHVIFLSPLLKDTQYGYDSTMAQTIGRVRRHGQKKEIHIYRIVALDTVDVDFLEQRERRKDALVERDAPKIKKPTSLTKKPAGPQRTQLVRSENGHFSLQPQSWLIREGAGNDDENGGVQKVRGKSRVLGYEDFSSLVKFSKNFTDDDD